MIHKSVSLQAKFLLSSYQFAETPPLLNISHDTTSEGKWIFKVAGIKCWEDKCFAAKF